MNCTRHELVGFNPGCWECQRIRAEQAEQTRDKLAEALRELAAAGDELLHTGRRLNWDRAILKWIALTTPTQAGRQTTDVETINTASPDGALRLHKDPPTQAGRTEEE